MNILSLFDGMSCCQIALNRAGIKYDKYFASEIDKYAIQVTQANYPDTIQLGSVTDIMACDLPPIWLMCGGSPCQNFSFAGKRKGMATKCEQEITTLEQYLDLKQQGFEFEGQSYLFWEFVRLLHEVKPKYFLLENVMMEERWERIITRTLGVHPIVVNSSLVSAQNRKRNFWTNIGLEPAGLFGYPVSTITQPKDKGILLKDILESEVADKYYLSDKMLNYLQGREGKYSNVKINPEKTGTMNTKNNSCQLSTDPDTTLITDPNRKARTFTAGGHSGGLHSQMDLVVGSIKFGRTQEAKEIRKENMKKGKDYNTSIRRLTEIECERLQCVPDNFTNHVSSTQRYKMLGNGFTVDVVAHIFSFLR